MKKQIFLVILTGMGLGIGFFGSSLNAMRRVNPMDIGNLINHDVRPGVLGAGARAGQAPGVCEHPAVAPANRQALTEVLKKLFTAPWALGSSITSFIHNSTTNVEPASKVLMRCILEGILCGVSLYFASSDGLGLAANKRLQLADFALEDIFSGTPSHFTTSRLWIAISGLQYAVTFLGLTGLRLYAWFFGVIIGLRCAYDTLIKLPISVVSGNSEAQRRRTYPFNFGLND
ncbi:MAG: hypothetical protein V1646_04315 [bacterium]